MRILHISEGSLPDWRIEKAALTAKKNGHVVLFAGTVPIKTDNKVFNKIYKITWDFRAKYNIPYYSYLLKKQIKKVLTVSNPDIIHAHQIIPAKLISKFNIPYIFDDHEYSSSHARIIYEAFVLQKNKFDIYDYNLREKLRWWARTSLKKYTIRLWTKWEKEIVSNVPTITVSNTIASDLKKLDNAKQIFVVPNYPLKNETIDIDKIEFKDKQSCVYAGSESPKYTIAYRNIEGLVKLFKDNNIGNLILLGMQGKSSDKVFYKKFLPRESMFKEMSNYSIGLIPWKKHWSHKFMNPNKAYEYIHSGLFVMFTSDLISVSATLKDNCETFEDYDELVEKLEYYKNDSEELYRKRIKSYYFGRSNLLWEKYEDNILEAYKLC